MSERLVKADYHVASMAQEDGMLAIPAAPGLGVELDPDAVAKLTGSRDF